MGHRRIVKKGQGGASLQSKTGGAKGGQGGATKKWWGEGWKRGPTYKDTVLDKKVLLVELSLCDTIVLLCHRALKSRV